MDVKLQGIEGSTQVKYGEVENGVKLARDNKCRYRWGSARVLIS